MPGLFSRLKNFVFEEVIKSSEVNAEFNNIINHMDPTSIDNYSSNVAQMQIQTNPGALGTESLSPTLGGEIERLRYVINRITGQTYWYQQGPINLVETNNLINQISGLPPNRIVSGATVSATDMVPAVIVPTGTTNSLTIKATTTPLLFRIAGAQYTLAADLVISGLVQAPSTNNTALVNDASLVGDVFSTVKGELGSTLKIDTTGSEITNLVGKYAGFKISNGIDAEYFTAFVKSSTELVSCRRGFLFDKTVFPSKRITISDNDTITLMKMAFIFIKTDLSAEAVYTNPTYSSATPSSPSVGDYWFDVTNQFWKRFNGSAWLTADATLIGIALTDTANTVMARSEDFFSTKSDLLEIRLTEFGNTYIKGSEQGGTIAVLGRVFTFGADDITWDITTDLESGYTENSDTMYFLYITENGEKKVSPNFPQIRQDLAGGAYHPYKQWRAVGMAYNDASSNFVVFSLLKMFQDSREYFLAYGGNGGGSVGTYIPRYTTTQDYTIASVIPLDSATDGLLFSCYWPSTVVASWQFGSGVYTQAGFSLNANATEIATSLSSTPTSKIITYSEITSGFINAISPQMSLKVGDKFRAHGGVTLPASTNAGNSPGQRVTLSRVR